MRHERRSEPRAEAMNLVRVRSHRFPGFFDVHADDLLGRTLDVSLSGMRLELRSWLPLRCSVTFELAIGNQILDMGGLVRHAERFDAERCGLGIEFEDVTPEHFEILLEHVILQGAYD